MLAETADVEPIVDKQTAQVATPEMSGADEPQEPHVTVLNADPGRYEVEGLSAELSRRV